jgi:hypothetical protein
MEGSMPIMAAHSRNDARGAARLLAIAARDSIANPAVAHDREVALNNVYRLLEAFRANAFFDADLSARQSQQGTADTLTLLPPVQRNQGYVRDALDRAIGSAFAGESRDHAIEIVENVLRAVTYPNEFRMPSRVDQRRAAYFFDELLRNLQFS